MSHVCLMCLSESGLLVSRWRDLPSSTSHQQLVCVSLLLREREAAREAREKREAGGKQQQQKKNPWQQHWREQQRVSRGCSGAEGQQRTAASSRLQQQGAGVWGRVAGSGSSTGANSSRYAGGV